MKTGKTKKVEKSKKPKAQRPMNLNDAYGREKEILTLQLDQLRSMVTHAGEKGRVLERYVENFVRDALPQEYGVTTGFIAFPPESEGDEPTLSNQLDIIIYDALKGAPLIRFPTCDVLPLEAVVAYVEVKAQLKAGIVGKSTIYACVKQAQSIRKHTRRYYHTSSLTDPQGGGVHYFTWLSVRSYVFAFETPENAAELLSSASSKLGEHAELSGFYINRLKGASHAAFYMTKPAHAPQVTSAAFEDALLVFRQQLLLSLARFGHPYGVVVENPQGDRSIVSTPYLKHYVPKAIQDALDQGGGNASTVPVGGPKRGAKKTVRKT